MNRTRIPLWLRSLLFLAVFVVLYLAIQPVFSDIDSSQVYLLEQMITDQQDVDVVILGSSHSFCAFDPAIIDSLVADTSTINLSIPNLSVAHSALLLRQMIEQGKTPQLVIVEMFSLQSAMEDTVQTSFFNYYSHTWNPAYLAWIAQYYPPEHLLAPLFPLINQHENWKLPTFLLGNLGPDFWHTSAIQSAITSNPGYEHDGFRPYPNLVPDNEYNGALNNDHTFAPTEANLRGLEQLIALAERHDIQLLFVLVPYITSQHSDFSQLDAVAEQYNLSMHTIQNPTKAVYDRLDFRDRTHLNVQGAISASVSLSGLLAEALDRPFDSEQAEQYAQLHLDDLTISHTADTYTITISPSTTQTDWMIEWTIEANDEILVAESGHNLTHFRFPKEYLEQEDFILHITLTQGAFPYPLRFLLAPYNF